MELILTLDVGTTSVKACLFDRQLRQTALTSREYALQTRGVCAEVEAQVYLDAAAQCILALPAEARAKVCAVALTTQGETLLCVDRQGKALRPAIVWLDSRAEAQAARLAAALEHRPAGAERRAAAGEAALASPAGAGELGADRQIPPAGGLSDALAHGPGSHGKIAADLHRVF